jgi:hypothetical protein
MGRATGPPIAGLGRLTLAGMASLSPTLAASNGVTGLRRVH